MSQANLFRKLGAPLANSRWSWGSVRTSDNTVFLRVWQDRARTVNEKHLVQLSHNHEYHDSVEDLGYLERLKHIELVKTGARCFLVVCRAADPKVLPRKVLSFNDKEIFPTGKLVEIDNEVWIEMGIRVPISEVI